MDQSYSGLSKRIEEIMAGFSGEYAYYCSDNRHIISKDSDLVYETASCIKTFILLVLAKGIEDQGYSKDQIIPLKADHYISGSGILRSLSHAVSLSIEDMATLMIIVSDNVATNCLIDWLGLEQINEGIEKFGFKNTRLLHPINFDQYHDLGCTTAREYGLLFEGLLSGKFLEPTMAKWVLEILSKQKYQSMFVKAMAPALLDEDYLSSQGQVTILSKSGALDQVRNDGGIVRTPLGDYVLVFFTRNFKDHFYHNDHESYRYGSQVTNLIFNHFISKEGSLI